MSLHGGIGDGVSGDILDSFRKVRSHPCFSEKAQHRFGRVHLPVAPKCNIQCNYCDRRFDCVNESRPGVTSKVITPEEALLRTEKVIRRHHFIRVVAVAGPGEPLYNPETFSTYELVKRAFPWITLCVSTNGLLLPDYAGRLRDLGVSHLTVTINAVTPETASKIYSFVELGGSRYRGLEASRLLLERQWEGLARAVELGMMVKVNTVYIPSVNDAEIPKVAELAAERGAFMQNVMPLIPLHRFSHLRPPTPSERKEMQKKCSAYIRQMTHCRQCRADACGLLGRDIGVSDIDRG